MAWDRQKSRERIAKFRSDIEQKEIKSAVLNENYAGVRARNLGLTYDGRGPVPLPILNNIPIDQPILVDGVHIYANLINFPELEGARLAAGSDAHKALMAFLHVHYQACDFAVAQAEARRVDFHGPRLHAVTIDPLNDEAARVRKAVYLAYLIQYYGNYLSEMRLNGLYRAKFRIGIDTGRAIAIDSGRRKEPEPLFLGNPANYAAKLAEPDWENPIEGIYLSDTARRAVGLHVQNTKSFDRVTALSTSEIELLVKQHLAVSAQRDYFATGQWDQRVRQLVEDQVSDFERELKAPLSAAIEPARILFSELKPPLRNIEFENLSAAKSLRGSAVSLFGDIDGFTVYIRDHIANGQIGSAVRNIHVIRGELAAVLRDDFSGRKVRFIGDCIHGLIAEGRNGTDLTASVTAAAVCSTAMLSSFELCSTMLDDMDGLGLAVGFEMDQTPVTRLGLRGERSVRCAVSYSTVASEREQQRCKADEIGIGTNAFTVALPRVRGLFPNRTGKRLRYPATVEYLNTIPTPAAPTSAAGFAAPLKAHAV